MPRQAPDANTPGFTGGVNIRARLDLCTEHSSPADGWGTVGPVASLSGPLLGAVVGVGLASVFAHEFRIRRLSYQS